MLRIVYKIIHVDYTMYSRSYTIVRSPNVGACGYPATRFGIFRPFSERWPIKESTINILKFVF